MALKKVRRQGAQILRNEEYLWYAAVTKDAAQRSIRTFYEAIRITGGGSIHAEQGWYRPDAGRWKR
jgi:hypothetical protein